MATTYVVLRDVGPLDSLEVPHFAVAYYGIEAANAEKACRTVADEFGDDELTDGVTLVAVPVRNWDSGRNTFKAETRRRLLKS